MNRISELRERGISLAEAVEQDAAVKQKSKSNGVQKRAVLVKAGDAEGLSENSPMRPTDEQLAKINKFTRRTVTADEVVAFKTYSCNDMPDRDDDQFTTECVKGFAALEGPFSSVGKSYMIGHDYSKNAVGRIFDVGVEKVNGVTFLTNEVYIPNTDANKSFIENIDFGVNWAVSVGVMLSASKCSVCGSGFSSWGYWCVNGHDKGAFYDPKSDETDDWGYPLPVNSSTNGAVKCVRQFTEPKDFYELSQVFLGAQYDAQLAKGITKAAGSLKVPILGLSQEEAKGIDVVHEPEEVSVARSLYNVKTTDEGLVKWVDEEGLAWVFDTNDASAGTLCLGKSSEEDDDQEEENAGDQSGSVEEEHASGDESSDGGDDRGSDSEGGSEDQSSSDGAEHVGGDDSGDSVEVTDNPEEDTEENETEDEEEEMDKAAVLRAAAVAKLPTAIIEKAADAEDNGLAIVLRSAAEQIESLSKSLEIAQSKIVLADDYVKSLKSEAIDWYTKSHLDPTSNKGVDVSGFQKMLNAFGDDIDLIKTAIEEQKALAQAKFPASVRRSSFPDNSNDAGEESKAPTVTEEHITRFATSIHR